MFIVPDWYISAFYALSTIAGSLLLLAGLFWIGAWAVVRLLAAFKIWHNIALAASVVAHGKKFAEHQFWWAIQERASWSESEAQDIVDFVAKHRKGAK